MVAGNFIDLIFLFPQVFNFFLLFSFEVIQCFYILFKLGDSQMSFFCIFFSNTPNRLLVNAKIMVRQDIPETGDVRPRNLRMLIAKLAGKVLDGFTQILKFPGNETDYNTLGMWFRVYFDLGVREQEHRGMVKSAGAAG